MLKKRLFSRLIWSVVGLFVLLAACEENDDDPVVTAPDPDEPVEVTLLERINASDSLKVFAQILNALDEEATTQLSAVLNGTTDYTLFAPIDGAEPPLALETDPATGTLVFTEDEATLWEAIVRYHLVAGSALKSADLTEGQTLTTVLGETITVRLDGGVFLSDATDTDAQVVRADVLAENGVVHFIDKVLVPQQVADAPAPDPDSEPETDATSNGVREVLAANPSLSTFLAAIELFGLEAELLIEESDENGRAQLSATTLFVPNNDAFDTLLAKLGDEYNSLEDFDTPEEQQLWQAALRYHISPTAPRLAASFTNTDGESLATLLDENLTVLTQTPNVRVQDSESGGLIVEADQEAGSNVLHVIDFVLRPQAFYTEFPEETTGGAEILTMSAFFRTRPELSILVAAVEKVGEDNLFFMEPGADTYFAPNNDAFDSLFVTLGEDYSSLEDFDTENELKALRDILLHQHASSYLCLERMIGIGQSPFAVNRLFAPIDPQVPDRRNEIVTIKGESSSTVVIKDDAAREANIVETDIAMNKNVPACAVDGTTNFGFTDLVHITDLVLLKQVFLTPDEPY